MSKIFKLLKRKLENDITTVMTKKYQNVGKEDQDLNDILIREINKRKTPLVRNRDSLRISNISHENTNKDIDMIYYILKSIGGFRKFLRFNNISDEAMKKAIFYIKHKYIRKGTVLFEQGDSSTEFYGIIRGRISVRAKPVNETSENKFQKLRDKPSNLSTERNANSESKKPTFKKEENDPTEDKSSSFLKLGYLSKLLQITGQRSSEKRNSRIKSQSEIDLEVERFQLTDGDCFGEWAIIYEQKRSASAYAIEDTDLFYIDKEPFNFFIAQKILKSYSEKNQFILRQITSIGSIENSRMIVKRIDPIFSESYKQVYLQNDKAECFYLVYSGEYSLEIKELNSTLLILTRGSFAGLELLFGENKFKYALKTRGQEFNVLLKIDLKLLGSKKEEVMQELKPLYIRQESIIQSTIENKKKLKSERKYKKVQPVINIKDLNRVKNSLTKTFDIKNIIPQNNTNKTLSYDTSELKISKTLQTKMRDRSYSDTTKSRNLLKNTLPEFNKTGYSSNRNLATPRNKFNINLKMVKKVSIADEHSDRRFKRSASVINFGEVVKVVSKNEKPLKHKYINTCIDNWNSTKNDKFYNTTIWNLPMMCMVDNTFNK